jgi:hypothetical protein
MDHEVARSRRAEALIDDGAASREEAQWALSYPRFELHRSNAVH